MLAPLRSGLIGAGLSLASLPVHFVIVHALSVEIAALVLALVAGIYVGFAVQDGRVSNLIVEGIVAIAFIGAALAGLVAFAWAIPLAYALHGVWDMAHEAAGGVPPRRAPLVSRSAIPYLNEPWYC